MIKLEVTTNKRGVTQKGGTQFSVRTAQDLENWVRANHVIVSKEILKQFQAKDKFPKKEDEYVVITDGRIGAPIENVKAFGKTQFTTKVGSIAEVVKEAAKLVHQRSVVKSGYYRRHNVLIYNGKVVAKGLSNINVWLNTRKSFKENDRFRILNITPYSRKLERRGARKSIAGKNKGKNDSVRRIGKTKAGLDTVLANGTYLLTARKLKTSFPAFKNNIRFSFIPLDPAIARVWNSSAKDTTYTFKKGKISGIGRPYLYASISISVNPQGVLNTGSTEAGSNL